MDGGEDKFMIHGWNGSMQWEWQVAECELYKEERNVHEEGGMKTFDELDSKEKTMAIPGMDGGHRQTSKQGRHGLDSGRYSVT